MDPVYNNGVSPVTQVHVHVSKPSLLMDIVKAFALNFFVSLIVMTFEYQAPLLALGIRAGLGIVSLVYLFGRHVTSRYISGWAWRSQSHNSNFHGAAGQPMYNAFPGQQATTSYNPVFSGVAGQPMYNAYPSQPSPAHPAYSQVAGQQMFSPPRR